ncbi:MAG: hypothetical protein ABF651_04730 [Sporolactobacillus sp.]
MSRLIKNKRIASREKPFLQKMAYVVAFLFFIMILLIVLYTFFFGG